MATIEDAIKEVEAEIAKTQVNKHTEYHIGKLKAKIARLKDEQEKRRVDRAAAEERAIRSRNLGMPPWRW